MISWFCHFIGVEPSPIMVSSKCELRRNSSCPLTHVETLDKPLMTAPVAQPHHGTGERKGEAACVMCTP